MVVALGPGRFYGSALPRPRYQPNGCLFDEGSRAYPPSPVNEALIQWAEEAHWRRGGWRVKPLSQIRRKSGRIDGSINRLKNLVDNDDDDGVEVEVEVKPNITRRSRDSTADVTRESSPESEEDDNELTLKKMKKPTWNASVLREYCGKGEKKRAGVMCLPREEEPAAGEKKRRRVRKLVDEFDKIATAEGIAGVAVRTRSRRTAIADDDVVAGSSEKAAAAASPTRRTSPRKKLNEGELAGSPEKAEALVASTRRTSPRKKLNEGGLAGGSEKAATRTPTLTQRTSPRKKLNEGLAGSDEKAATTPTPTRRTSPRMKNMEDQI